MADKPLFDLDSKGRWRLAFDAQQWILQKATKRKTPRPTQRPPPSQSEVPPDSMTDWRGVSFVGGRKATLHRLFREKGVVLTAEAQARFDALPEQFMDFISAPERFAARLAEAA